MIEKHLAQAEQHVADGERHITRQRQIIAELERDRHDAGSAKELLTIFEETQAIHIADRDRLKEEARIADQQQFAQLGRALARVIGAGDGVARRQLKVDSRAACRKPA